MSLENCRLCPRSASCQNIVPGLTLGKASFVVAEKPDSDSELMGEAFLGRAGLYVRSLLEKAGLRSHLTYAVKCAGLAPKNLEIKACRVWLWEEIQTLKPRIILTLGALPSRLLLKKEYTPGEVYEAGFAGLLIVPWTSPHEILMGGRKLTEQTLEVMRKVKELETA